ncbi:hypothetical protein [Alicyclobacillus sp. SO9]|uniref:hypothetical protein n=1 Tax=Alicyclobacillus sp. SO9 TaxID=2665646 RepID=UPI0018E87A8D|nr:hypothetical protein [Alicyclobacillus sp. SO9]QQE80423.1 hypothetical protein GI364_08420 [Alicyclobacillus sp. SO9]
MKNDFRYLYMTYTQRFAQLNNAEHMVFQPTPFVDLIRGREVYSVNSPTYYPGKVIEANKGLLESIFDGQCRYWVKV